MIENPSRLLKQLRLLQRAFDPVSSREKSVLLSSLEQVTLHSAQQVVELHDLLCFMRTYPDSGKTLRTVDSMLDRFADRCDLVQFRGELYDTGIIGTAIHYRFYWQTTLWLYRRWPRSIRIDWPEWEDVHGLDELWPLILPYPVTEALETTLLSSRELIDLMKREEETDAGYLVRNLVRLRVPDAVREKYYDDLDIPLVLDPAADTPSLTGSRTKPAKPVYGFSPLTQPGPDFGILDQRPVHVESVSTRKGNRLVDLARVQMITHGRDLYAFMHADPADVRIFNYDHGMQFVCYGLKPERRSLLEAMYIILIMRNGVPIGYTQAVALFHSAEINFNVFDVYRGVEASRIFLYTLSMARYLFASDTFIINTQQLGEGNEEALQSGAFWFYHKHGFRPADSGVGKVMREELKRKKSQKGYRSGKAVLKKLAQSELHLFLDGSRETLVTNLPTERIGLVAGRYMETRAATSDPHGERLCMQECACLLGVETDRLLSHGERIAWRRWSPVVMNLPGVGSWGQARKAELARIISAKGGKRESEYVLLFDRHRPLQRALLEFAKPAP